MKHLKKICLGLVSNAARPLKIGLILAIFEQFFALTLRYHKYDRLHENDGLHEIDGLHENDGLIS